MRDRPTTALPAGRRRPRSLSLCRKAVAALWRSERPWRLLSLLLVPVIQGCSPATIINALVPRDGYRIVKDVAYGSDPRQRLDWYVPEHVAGAAPVVVFFYGGNWQDGSKDMYLFAGQALVSRGFIVAIPDYRLYPQVRYPAFIEDGAAAVGWVAGHAGDLGGDPRRLYLMGHSAGAYIAAMLTLDRRWLAQVGIDSHRLRGMVGLAGPYDFLPLHDPKLKVIFGPEAQLPATQPINYVDGAAPPMRLAAGAADTTVRPGNTTRLAARIRNQGGHVVERYYPGISHTELVGALAWPLRFLAPVLDDCVQFMKDPGAPDG